MHTVDFVSCPPWLTRAPICIFLDLSSMAAVLLTSLCLWAAPGHLILLLAAPNLFLVSSHHLQFLSGC